MADLVIHVEVHDNDRFNKQSFLGTTSIRMLEIRRTEGNVYEGWCPVAKSNGADAVSGEIFLRIKLIKEPSSGFGGGFKPFISPPRKVGRSKAGRTPGKNPRSKQPIHRKLDWSHVKSRTDCHNDNATSGQRPPIKGNAGT